MPDISYRDAAAAIWGEAGAYAHDSYARLRAAHFPRLPAEIPIVIMYAPGCVAMQYRLRSSLPAEPGVILGREAFEGWKDMLPGGVRWVDDVLTHDMLHLELARCGLDYHDGSEDWDAAAAELSPAILGRELKLPEDAMRPNLRSYGPAEGKLTEWPHIFRPGSYTWGRKIRCPDWC